jgi:hypothetical protein
MKSFLLGLVLSLVACAPTPTLPVVDLNAQREVIATEWLENHHYNSGERLIVYCPSQRWGTPLCDVRDSEGKVVFWLGCHIGREHSFCIRQDK